MTSNEGITSCDTFVALFLQVQILHQKDNNSFRKLSLAVVHAVGQDWHAFNCYISRATEFPTRLQPYQNFERGAVAWLITPTEFPWKFPQSESFHSDKISCDTGKPHCRTIRSIIIFRLRLFLYVFVYTCTLWLPATFKQNFSRDCYSYLHGSTLHPQVIYIIAFSAGLNGLEVD